MSPFSPPAVNRSPWTAGLLLRSMAILAMALAVVILASYPLRSAWLWLGVISYAIILCRRRESWLLLLPALLPALDLSPWSGWFFVDEFDVFVLITLAIGYWQKSDLAEGPSRASLVAVALLTVSYLASTAVALLPFSPIDLNSFNNYLSQYNALRVFKGLLWALALWPLIQEHAGKQSSFRRLALGMQMGLLLVSLLVIIERLLFVGVGDLAAGFRVTGPFFSMHTGGQHIDAYLAMAIPFVFVPTIRWNPLGSRAWSVLLLLLGLYATVVTYSRGALVAVFVAAAIVLVGRVVRNAAAEKRRYQSLGRLAAVAAVAAVLAMTVMASDFFRSRFATIQADWQTRRGHWRAMTARMPNHMPTWMFGMGLGSFPRVYADNVDLNLRPARYQYCRESDNRFVRLHAGRPVYFGQQVAVRPQQTYRVQVDIRGAESPSGLLVLLSEKNLLSSFRETSVPVRCDDRRGKWHHREIGLNTDKIGAATAPTAGRLFRRPVTLAVVAATGTGQIDVDNLKLIDSTGNNLLKNSDFSSSNNHWFFTSDDHLAWHIKNIWVHLYFEQGVLGVAAFCAVLGILFNSLIRLWRSGDESAPILAASVLGFLLVGIFGSLLDAPRITMLFYLIVFFALCHIATSLKVTAD